MADGRGGAALATVARRSAAQWPLLVAVVVTMTLSLALVGTGALLAGPGRAQALDAAASASRGPASSGVGPGTVTLTAGTTDTSRTAPPGARDVGDRLRGLLTDAVAPLPATVSTWLSTPAAAVDGDPARRAYLLDADTAQEHAALTAGRWPRAGGGDREAVLPSSAAAALGLGVGDRVRVGSGAAAVPVVVVGLLDPDGSAEWARDRLGGRGSDVESAPAPVHGPFLVAPGTLLAADAPVGGLSLAARVDLAGRPGELAGLAARVQALGDAADEAVGTLVDYTTVRSGLGAFVDDARARLVVTTSTVLTALALVVVLAGAAVALLARLLAARRGVDTALRLDRGASRAQVVVWAAVEAVVLALLAALLAVPLARAGYALLLRVPPLDGRWPAGFVPTGSGPALAALAVTALALAVACTAPALLAVRRAAAPAGTPHRTAGAVARSGADLLLLGLAVVAYLQLRAHRPVSSAVDPVLVVAPALCLVAAAALALRAVPLVAAGAEVLVRRGRGLAVPLAAWELARGRAAAGVFLVVLATAAGTFAVGMHSTWTVSQRDQADAQVGTDVRVPAQGQATPPALQTLPAGAAVAPVARRTVALGSRPGSSTLVAVDAARADAVLRGRLDGGATWGRLLAPLVPAEPAGGVDAPDGPLELEVTGGLAGSPGMPVPAHLSLVLQDGNGVRVAVPTPDVTLDGTAHRVSVRPPAPGTWRVVALRAVVPSGVRVPSDVEARLDLQVRVLGASAAAPAVAWSAATEDHELTSSLQPRGGADSLGFSAVVATFALEYVDLDVVVTGFAPVDQLPVVVSTSLAERLGLGVGDPLDVGLASTSLPASVVGVVPYVPSAPGDAVVVDQDTFSRALLGRFDLSSTVDEWWVATPDPSAVARAAGGVARTDVAEDLTHGPLRVAVGAGLLLLVAAALALAAAGSAARELAVAHERRLEAARLRALGVSRRLLTATGTTRHLLVTVLAVVLGAIAGALVVRLVGPVLATSATGAAPVPAARAAWPWAAEAALLGSVLVCCVLAGLPAARGAARRSPAALLRSGEAR